MSYMLLPKKLILVNSFPNIRVDDLRISVEHVHSLYDAYSDSAALNDIVMHILNALDIIMRGEFKLNKLIY